MNTYEREDGPEGRPSARASRGRPEGSSERKNLVNALRRQPALGIQRRLAPHARCRDRLAVQRIGDVARGEHAFDVRRAVALIQHDGLDSGSQCEPLSRLISANPMLAER